MSYTIRTSSKPRIFRIYNMTRHCCFKTGVPSLMPLLFVSTQCSVFIVLSPGTGLRHYSVHTQIQNSIHQFILQCTGKPPADSTIERRCNSTAALLILWRRFRLISSLPFNFCSLFLSNYNFTPNTSSGDGVGVMVVGYGVVCYGRTRRHICWCHYQQSGYRAIRRWHS